MEKRNIWIDCDPGIDDALALAVAAASRDTLKLHGISTVAGNQVIDLVTDNALRLRSFLSMDEVPVVRGAAGPVMRVAQVAGDVHGENGLGNIWLPETEGNLAADNGLLFMRNVLMNLPKEEKMTLVPIGPLTNIGLLFKTFPEVKEKIDEIVLMGGSSIGGNVTAAAEFNIWEDPEGAQIVFDAGIPIVMCGLDLTSHCGLDREQVATLLNKEGVIENTYGKMLNFYFNTPMYRDKELVCIHDAATILYLTNPEMFKGIYTSVQVDCTTDINRGVTVCDRRTEQQRNDIVFMLNGVDEEKFQKVLLEKLASL